MFASVTLFSLLLVTFCTAAPFNPFYGQHQSYYPQQQPYYAPYANRGYPGNYNPYHQYGAYNPYYSPAVPFRQDQQQPYYNNFNGQLNRWFIDLLLNWHSFCLNLCQVTRINKSLPHCLTVLAGRNCLNLLLKVSMNSWRVNFLMKR